MTNRLNTWQGNSIHQIGTKQSFHVMNGIILTKKQRNIPAEIWAKRNVLKKLTLQLKFNKSQTQQYRKIRTELNLSRKNEPLQKSQKVADKNHFINQFLSPTNQKSMRKLSTAKAENISKYTDNFFAANVFSINGLKSYHYRSSSFQGNNFINVSKAVITSKSPLEIKNSQRRKSLSHRQTNQGHSVKGHRRSSSNVEDYINFDKPSGKKKTDFLKVASKRLHLNSSDLFPPQELKQKSSVFLKRPKTQMSQNLTLTIQKRRKSENQIKIESIRPKSCIVKPKRRNEFSNCQGWKTKNSAREQQEPFPIFFRF